MRAFDRFGRTQRITLEDEVRRLRRDLAEAQNATVPSGQRRPGGALRAKPVRSPDDSRHVASDGRSRFAHNEAGCTVGSSASSPLCTPAHLTAYSVDVSAGEAQNAVHAAARAAEVAAADHAAAAAVERAAAAADRAAAERAAAAAIAAAETATSCSKAELERAQAAEREVAEKEAAERARRRLREAGNAVIEGMGSPEERRPRDPALAAAAAFTAAQKERQQHEAEEASRVARERLQRAAETVIEGMGERSERRHKDGTLAAAEAAVAAFKDAASERQAQTEQAAAPERARERLRTAVSTVVEGMGSRDERRPKDPAVAAAQAFSAAAAAAGPPQADRSTAVPSAVDLGARLSTGSPPNRPAPRPAPEASVGRGGFGGAARHSGGGGARTAEHEKREATARGGASPFPGASAPSASSVSTSPRSPELGGWSPTSGRQPITP